MRDQEQPASGLSEADKALKSLKQAYSRYVHNERNKLETTEELAARLAPIMVRAAELIALYPNETEVVRASLRYYANYMPQVDTIGMLKACMDQADDKSVLYAEIKLRAKETIIDEKLDLASALIGLIPVNGHPDPDVTFVTAHIMRQKNGLQAAIDYFEEIYQSSPQSFDIADAYRKFLKIMKLHGRKLEVLTKMAHNFPDDRTIFAAYLSKLLKHEAYDEGLAYAESMAARQPDYAWAIASCGRCHEKLGNMDKAEECYLKAIQVDPREYRAIQAMAMLQAERGKPELALHYVRECANLAIRTPDLMFLEARVLFLKGDVKAASGICMEFLQQQLQFNMLAMLVACAEPNDPRVEMFRIACSQTKEKREIFSHAHFKGMEWRKLASANRGNAEWVGKYTSNQFWDWIETYNLRPMNIEAARSFAHK